jgi:D-alanine-D-alanine ligase
MFFYCDTDAQTLTENDMTSPEKSPRFQGPIHPADSLALWKECAVALLAMHGEYGEDGVIQGFCEAIGVPYTGSGVFSSAVGMEKITSKILFENSGLHTPPSSIYRTDKSGVSVEEIAKNHGFPCFVKCPQSGSSRLMGRADSKKALEDMLATLCANSAEILIESYIAGEEYTCPVLEYPDGAVKALPPILIRPVTSSYFDFTAKYTSGASEEIAPAPCSRTLTKRLQDVALTAHQAIKCKGLSRTDMIVKDDIIYVLEINTLPGLTAQSLVPKAYAAEGGTFAELVDILIKTALAGKKS